MISAYRTGITAGNSAARLHPGLSPTAQKIAAQEELNRRKQLNIAHIYPETEFTEGFVEGYNTPITLSDGLTLASQRGPQ
jgi:hypothetical protein